MAALPAYVKYEWRPLAITPDTALVRSQMERGIPKQRRITSDVMETMLLTMHFDTAADATSFEAWFYTTINAGADWFDLVHPRTGATEQVRSMEGKLGALQPLNRNFSRTKRDMLVERVRAAL
jgi:hypothetical protein